MFELQGTVMHYSWGTRDAIPEFLGRTPDALPYAEYWLGAHPLSPSVMRGGRLDEALADEPALLGDSHELYGTQLPYLMKVLSARHALSIQAHPNRAQAEDGFAREEALGVARNAPGRTYRDDWPKPELMIAMTEFHTLAGFRDPHETAGYFSQLGLDGVIDSITGPLTARDGAAGLEEVFLDVLSLSGERRDLTDQVLAACVNHRNDEGPLGDFARTALELDETFPSNPGIIAALLMNHVVLQPGEALYIPCGRMHAHLRGTGIEIMATSDNVIRGGLTDKHIDVDELVRVVDFNPVVPEPTAGELDANGVRSYPVPCPEFDVWHLDTTAERVLELPAPGMPRIALVVDGEATFDNGESTLTLGKGHAMFAPAPEANIQVRGDAEVFVASPGVS